MVITDYPSKYRRCLHDVFLSVKRELCNKLQSLPRTSLNKNQGPGENVM